MTIRDNEIETVIIWFITGHIEKFLTKNGGKNEQGLKKN